VLDQWIGQFCHEQGAKLYQHFCVFAVKPLL
jgi:hypothetical protein